MKSDTAESEASRRIVRLARRLPYPSTPDIAGQVAAQVTQGDKAWSAHVVPAGDGIVRWDDFAQGVKDVKFNGTISLHGEYEAKDFAERKEMARREVEFLRKRVG